MPRKLVLAALALAAIWSCSDAPLRAQSLEYQTLDFGTTGTFLTGIRGDNITGNYVVPDGETGACFTDSDDRVWSPFPVATPNQSNYPGASAPRPMDRASAPWRHPAGGRQSTRPPRPRTISAISMTAPRRRDRPLDLAFPDQPGDRPFTFAHSTFGNTVVGELRHPAPYRERVHLRHPERHLHHQQPCPARSAPPPTASRATRLPAATGFRSRPRARLRAWLHL